MTVLSDDEVFEVRRFVQNPDIQYTFEDVSSLRDIYDEDVLNLIDTINHLRVENVQQRDALEQSLEKIEAGSEYVWDAVEIIRSSLANTSHETHKAVDVKRLKALENLEYEAKHITPPSSDGLHGLYEALDELQALDHD